MEVVDESQPGLLHADEVSEDRLALLGAVAGDRRVERGGVVAVGGDLRLDHLLGREVHQRGQLRHRRLPVQPAGQLVAGLRQLDAQLLEPPRNVHRPRRVPEEALDLADDVRQRERRELDLARDLEPVDGLDQADHPGLDDVLHVVPPSAEPARRETHQGHVHLDEGVARVLVLGCALLENGQPPEELARQLARVAWSHAPRRLDAGQRCAVRSGPGGVLDDLGLRPDSGGLHGLSLESRGTRSPCPHRHGSACVVLVP
ncbi:hypothetical protein QF032_000669 [Streptomyces achromogenes]|nr:hypothetical protein [Streptomyces achromogenes]